MEYIELKNTPKAEKLQIAEKFCRSVIAKDIVFLGVSGSVSYAPSEDDDIDIFIICREGKLWPVLFRAFLVRRKLGLKDICISLSMDEGYASDLFSRQAEYVVASDAIHVIPLYGSNYYHHLLSSSPFIARYFPEYNRPESQENFHPVRNFNSFGNFIFVFLAPFLFLKSMIINHRIAKSDPSKSFSTKIGLHHYYYDSAKYKRLKQMNEGLKL